MLEAQPSSNRCSRYLMLNKGKDFKSLKDVWCTSMVGTTLLTLSKWDGLRVWLNHKSWRPTKTGTNWMHVKRVLTRLIRGILHYCWDGFHQQCVMNPVVHTPVNSPHKPTSLAQQVSQLVGAIIDSRLKRTPTNRWPTGTPSPRWTLLLTLGLVASREALSTYGGPVCHTTKS